MSQSWDSVASMHDHQILLTVHRQFMHKQYPAWARLSIGTVRMRRWKRLQRPHPLAKHVCYGNVLALLERCYRLLTGMNRPRLSLRSRLGG